MYAQLRESCTMNTWKTRARMLCPTPTLMESTIRQRQIINGTWGEARIRNSVDGLAARLDTRSAWVNLVLYAVNGHWYVQ